MDLAIVGVEHAELHIVQLYNFIALGQVTEFLHQNAADSIEIFIAKFGVEKFVKTLN